MFRLVIGGLLVAAVVVIVAALYPTENAPDRGPSQAVGSALPPLAFPSLQGSTIDLRALRGRPVLLNVWATWCGPCRREMPALAMLARNTHDRLTVVAVDQGEDPSVVRSY